MATAMLITSFRPWKAHQPSNSSDDLLGVMAHQGQLPEAAVLLRHLPVNFQLAPAQVIAKLYECQPRLVICCGMAETRQRLTLERYGTQDNHRLLTTLPLGGLRLGTRYTAISNSAGRYVCNHLYYCVLAQLQHLPWPCEALFVHVPVLTAVNQAAIAADFALILQRLQHYARPGQQRGAA